MIIFDTTVQIKYNWAINNIRIPTSKYHCPHQFRITNIHQLFKNIYFDVPTIYKIQQW
nr:MAG TPA: hypothetical protein [Caudoviricetes sp.]